jgi:hypothetical protein
LEEQSNATRAIAHEPSIPLWSPDAARETVPRARRDEAKLSKNERRRGPRRPVN